MTTPIHTQTPGVEHTKHCIVPVIVDDAVGVRQQFAPIIQINVTSVFDTKNEEHRSDAPRGI
ncbi:MAG: hypothetical protein EBS29_03950 [Chloroflexia bacterium]|nr:hypothetical protein [Chloroflexia bacterium]